MLSICKKLRSGKIGLYPAIDSGEIPDHILHSFACAYAERALLREKQARREPDPRSWEALRIKRLWIEGQTTNEDLNAARAAANDAAWTAKSAARDASWYAAWSAARSAAWNAAEATKAAWQTEPLCALIEQYQDERASLLSLLLERKKQIEIQQSTKFWQAEIEDGLF